MIPNRLLRTMRDSLLLALILTCNTLVAQDIIISTGTDSLKLTSLVMHDGKLYASTITNRYYTIDSLLSFTTDTIPSFGLFNQLVVKFEEGRDGELYALASSGVLKLSPGGWVPTGFVPPYNCIDICIDQAGVIWSWSKNSPTGTITRFDSVVTNTFSGNTQFYYGQRWNSFEADDSGFVWLGAYGLFRFSSGGYSQFFPGDGITGIQVDELNNLYFIRNYAEIWTKNQNGFSKFCLDSIPSSLHIFPFWSQNWATAFHQGKYMIYGSNNSKCLLVEMDSAGSTITETGPVITAWDSAYSYLILDGSHRLAMGFSAPLSGIIQVLENRDPATVSGMVYHDANSNGQYDAADMPIQYLPVQNTATGRSFLTDVFGMFTDTLPDAIGLEWTVYPDLNYGWFVTTLPDTFTFLAQTNQAYNNLDFGLNNFTTNPNIMVGAYGIFLPRGWTSQVRFSAKNTSIYPIYNAEVFYIHDHVFDTVYCQVPPDYISPDTIMWVIDTLMPLQVRHFPVYLPLSDTVPLGSPISLEFYSICPVDVYAPDDTVPVKGNVWASMDPNDKVVLPDNDEHVIDPDDTLRYRIDFQNVGNYPAQAVVIRDTLSPFLDPLTFRLLSVSHPYTVKYNTGRELVFTFDPITLPDSASDFEGSMGSVTFEILPMANLAGGTVIENTAYIYFDANQPVQTGQTQSIVQYVSVDDFQPADEVRVYPNPAGNLVYCMIPGSFGPMVGLSVIDQLGRIRMHEIAEITPYDTVLIMDVSGLVAGTYFLRIIGEKEGISSHTFIKLP